MELLHIFLVSGHVFTFENVEILSDNDYAIKFNYEAVSDGFIKEATFFKQHVAGISTLDLGDD